MKKLLTSLTILALISPISLTNVNAQETESTKATIEITGDEGTINIEGSNELTFEEVKLELGKESYEQEPEKNLYDLTISDTRFGKVKYSVTAQLLGPTAEDDFTRFPTGTSFSLVRNGGITKRDINELAVAPDTVQNSFKFIVKEDGSSDESNVLIKADRTINSYQGAGTWVVPYTVSTLTIPHDETILEPGKKLGGTILWTMSNTSH